MPFRNSDLNSHNLDLSNHGSSYVEGLGLSLCLQDMLAIFLTAKVVSDLNDQEVSILVATP